jgi:hypothetical protein
MRRHTIPSAENSLEDAGMDALLTILGAMNVEEEPLSGGSWHPRRHARCRMFKPAHIVTERAVHDCVLLDLSPGGAQIYLVARAELPDLVTLLLPGGESRRMCRAWQRGSHIGLEAVGDPIPPS